MHGHCGQAKRLHECVVLTWCHKWAFALNCKSQSVHWYAMGFKRSCVDWLISSKEGRFFANFPMLLPVPVGNRLSGSSGRTWQNTERPQSIDWKWCSASTFKVNKDYCIMTACLGGGARKSTCPLETAFYQANYLDSQPTTFLAFSGRATRVVIRRGYVLM